MVIEGSVLEVMESMPLQLIVETQSRRVSVGLTIDTAVNRAGGRAEAGDLRPGDHVTISGPSSGRDAMVADSITILEE